MDRRELLRDVTAFGTMSYVASGFRPDRRPKRRAAPTRRASFPASRRSTSRPPGATIHGVVGGSGPPLLLLHGAPQTHVTWRLVAPQLAKSYTVVVPDLRGYGDSSKPADGENHANYSKRAMALDQVEVMKHFGFDRFPVVGHDRGGRVGHRLALDHPDKVTRLAVLDIVPTYYLYTHVDDRVRPGVLPLVQLPASGARSGKRSQGADRGAAGARDHRRSRSEYLAHRRACRRTSTGCARTIAPARRSTSSTTKRT